ncbi:Rpn family recombination-promoting nuclease/putative transposase [Sphingobacterium sp. SGR-19]|uniref:Rpn family recombination-promoting nuclease/putative transposase n=1 Tax=Sphingobacterium sp. SGR-19 TaxID=2710886 RepID=UPI0013ED0CB7|nr:Rpn family recombination-promoting nuclease/putative transposase [Sphingobacterium sp. SGR-19]NGM64996.1 Rpn family recombination-promoting nuclease/putative transposase [Sphingobacterium sp. SGR-19]
MKKNRNFLGNYVDMCTDFGMKLYFGPDGGKPNLINFLNGLFDGEKIIKDLEYRPAEHNGTQDKDRKVVFDLYCTSADSSHFIIEMQQLSQEFFKDRTVYYTSRLINKLVPRGHKGNTYELPEVYFVGILNFVLDRSIPNQYYYDVALCDQQSKKVFYDKLGYKLLVLANFNKEQYEIKSYMDMWLYLFRHMEELDEMPKFLDNRVFGLIFDIGKVANLTESDMKLYESSLKNKRDAESVRLTAIKEGRREGMEEGMEKGRLVERAKAEAEKLKYALNLKKRGLPLEDIAEDLGLTVEQVQKLK